jgi:hypothetical protein
MIEKGGTKGHAIFTLTCDYCGDECDEVFEEFQDAVDYKTDRDNGWATVKDVNGYWTELCPSCNNPRIIGKLKGVADRRVPGDDVDAAEAALRAMEDDKDGIEKSV